MPARQVKYVLLAIPVIMAGLWSGILCRRLEAASLLLTPPFRDLQLLLLWVLFLLLVVMVFVGMVAALLRGWRAAAIIFLLSGLALLASWGWSWPKAGLSLLYALVGSLQMVVTQHELQRRIRFSVGPVAENGRLTATVLALVLAGSLYLGLSAHVRDNGLSIPAADVERVTSGIAGEVVDHTPLSGLELLREEGVRQVKGVLDRQLTTAIQRVQGYVPPLAAIVLFLGLAAVVWLLWWVPGLVLYGVFALLMASGVVAVSTETVEVHRLVVR
jgi:hypothetical protein